MGRARRHPGVAERVRPSVGGAVQGPAELRPLPPARPRPAGVAGAAVPHLDDPLGRRQRRPRRNGGEGGCVRGGGGREPGPVLRRLPADDGPGDPDPRSVAGGDPGGRPVDHPAVAGGLLHRSRDQGTERRWSGVRAGDRAADLATSRCPDRPASRRDQRRAHPASMAARASSGRRWRRAEKRAGCGRWAKVEDALRRPSRSASSSRPRPSGSVGATSGSNRSVAPERARSGGR